LRLDSAGPLAGLKSLSYQAQRLAAARAERAGAFEALLVNEHGRLVEGSRSNLVVALAEGLLTPPLSDGCLAGTVRRRLLEAGRIAEGPLTPKALARARGIFLLNSLIGVLPVGSLDGRPVPIGADAVGLQTSLRWETIG
jgi:branched-subunit amino acid aminotransferase/4-amino-4-deoxychorismate lyase